MGGVYEIPERERNEETGKDAIGMALAVEDLCDI